jgi:putative PIN family toxin of toxin-antitoxin system
VPAAVIDTNVLVSAFLNPVGAPARVWAAGKARRYDLVTSPPLLSELLEVLGRPRILRLGAASISDAEAFIQGIASVANLVSVTGSMKLCRDPDDDLVLETAVVGRAGYLVSRDEDVTRDRDVVNQLKRWGVQIVTVSQFLTILSKTGQSNKETSQ